MERFALKPIIQNSLICTDNGLDEGLSVQSRGAPLVSISDSKLIGIASASMFQKGYAHPDVYTRVKSFTQWISSIIIGDLNFSDL